MIGYHFTSATLRDGRPIPPVGEWLEHDGPVVPCESGLHASEHPMDALQFAPGALLHRVELEGDLVSHGDPTNKWVGRRRKIVATLDATNMLREFARWCATQVLHLWDAPQVVRDYLATGDESLRAAAWDVARAAARAAAWDVARAAAWDVARAAARDAARAAARNAAWDAARAAARDAAWDAARDVARDAARAAARAAAQRQRLAAMVDSAFTAEAAKGAQHE